MTWIAALADTAAARPHLGLWLIIALIGVLASALCSGTETGIYTINRIRLHLLAAIRRDAALLDRMVKRQGRLLATLLIGNNMANYLTSYATTVLLSAARYSDWQMVLINAAILTPVLVIAGEVLPKDLFQKYGDRLTPRLGRPLWWFQQTLTYIGLLPMIDGISHAVARLLRSSDAAAELHPRRLVTELIKEGMGRGVISPYQSDIIERILHAQHRHVIDVMVPWSLVRKIRLDDPPTKVWELADRVPYSWFPAVDGSGRPQGAISVFDVLLRPPAECPPLAQLLHPLICLPADTTIRAALSALEAQGRPLALVTENRRPLGIVAVKDLIEQIVGDLDVW